jgi:hypothetical protein
MVAAALAFRQDPEFAMSALAHAYAVGYRGSFLRPLQAGACAALGRYAESAAVAEMDLAGTRSAAAVHGLRTLYGAAFIEGRLADAQAVLTRFPELRQDTSGFAPYLADLAARTARHAAVANPLDAFAAAPHHDLTGMMHGTHLTDDITAALADVRDGVDTIDCDSRSEGCFWFEVALPEVDALAFEIDFEATFASEGFSAQHVDVSIAAPRSGQDLDDDFRLYAMDWTVRLNHLHDALVYLRGLPRGTVPVPRLTGLHNHYKLLIARKDGMVAWSLNGQRYGCQPIRGQSGPKSFYVYSTSCHFIVRGLGISSFDAQPPAGWRPVERKRAAPESVPDPKGAADF